MNLEELRQIAETEQEAAAPLEHTVRVCVAASCLSCHSDQLKTALESEVKERGLEHKCKVKGVGCMGLCAAGPLVEVQGEQTVMYQSVAAEDAAAIIASLGGEPVARLELSKAQPFFLGQKKIVLENSGIIDPERIEDYIAAGGYESLVKALTTMTPLEVIDEVKKSGLRGRGGAGYPTGLKWSTVQKAASEDGKYVICNADEGDPGAFMDRSVLESDPHRVLEGMAIAAYAVGASKGYIYVRAEYPLAIKRLRNGHSAGGTDGAARHTTSAARASASASRFAWAPGPSSAAKRRR